MRGNTNYLTAIRGFACLLVIIAHILSGMPYIGINVAGTGKIGVWLFFILSAFLLTIQWLDKKVNVNVFHNSCLLSLRIHISFNSTDQIGLRPFLPGIPEVNCS